MTKTPGKALLLMIGLPLLCNAQTGQEQYLETGSLCVQEEAPRQCMESYGFICDRSMASSQAVGAYRLNCTLDLGDGREHYVQILSVDGGFNVETETTDYYDASEPPPPETDSDTALSMYIRQALDGFPAHSSGSISPEGVGGVNYQVGASRVEGRVSVRAMCGAIGIQREDRAASELQLLCERHMYRVIKFLSQTEATSPYRVPAVTDIVWIDHYANLVSADTAFVVEGQFTFNDPHRPCRWNNDCCPSLGATYLESCRAPTEDELSSINRCLAETDSTLSDAYIACLQEEGVLVGCEQQTDGSLLCH